MYSMLCAGQLLQEHSDIHKVAVDSLALNPAQSLIATGGADRTIQLHPYLLQVKLLNSPLENSLTIT